MSPRLDAIGLVVADMGETLAFYRRLGLELPDQAEAEVHVEVELPGGLRLMFDTVEVMQSFSGWEPPTGFGFGGGGGAESHRISLAFRCESPAEVDRLHSDIVAAGYRSHVEPFDAEWGLRYATVLDPNGNPIDLFSDL